mmetsp:Transcript_7394/g.16170  ORF Transcript_7394/g.16170 Transcript_7394/m.16170 type:complete len:207 (+) Transcript_7394:2328-2948(+)
MAQTPALFCTTRCTATWYCSEGGRISRATMPSKRPSLCTQTAPCGQWCARRWGCGSWICRTAWEAWRREDGGAGGMGTQRPQTSTHTTWASGPCTWAATPSCAAAESVSRDWALRAGAPPQCWTACCTSILPAGAPCSTCCSTPCSPICACTRKRRRRCLTLRRSAICTTSGQPRTAASTHCPFCSPLFPHQITRTVGQHRSLVSE